MVLSLRLAFTLLCLRLAALRAGADLMLVVGVDVDENAVEESDSVGLRAWVSSLASAGLVLMSPAAALVSEHKSVAGLPAAEYQQVPVYWNSISNNELRRS